MKRAEFFKLDEQKIKNNVKEVLQKLRIAQKLTQETVGEIINISRTSVGRHEQLSSKDIPTIYHLAQYAKLYDTSTDYILGIVDYPDEQIKVIKKRLNKLRASKNMTQKSVAEKLKISEYAIERHENDQIKDVPSILHLIEYAKLYDTSTDYILGIID